MVTSSNSSSSVNPTKIGKGFATSDLDLDVSGRDDLRYWQKKLTDPINTLEDKWRMVPAFLQTKGLMKQQIASFNYFIETQMKEIMKANDKVDSDVDPNFFLKFTDIRVKYPEAHDAQRSISYELSPHECRLRDITYAGNIYVDIEYVRGKQVIRKTGIEIGRMPIMLRSCRCILTNKTPEEMTAVNECPLDPGGYFIVKGSEKIILMQEQLSKNRIIVETDRLGMIQASVTSSTQERKSKTYVACGKGNKIVLKHNSLNADIPVFIVMRAMGILSDREITEYICGHDESYLSLLISSLEQAATLKIFTQQEALEYVGSKVKSSMRTIKYGVKRNTAEDARELLSQTVLAHIPVPESESVLNFRAKAVYVATMVRRVLFAVKEGGIVDDRDFVGNKRIESSGELMALLFEDLFKTWCTNIKRAVDMQLRKTNRTSQYDASAAVTQTSRLITDGLFRALSSGNWSLKRFKMERAGVTQILSRLSFVSALGMLTRITSQFEKTRKVSGPRSLQTSQWGMLCTSDTPEGEACGLVKNLALLAHVTTDAPSEKVCELAFALGVEDIHQLTGQDIYDSPATYVVFLNGVLLGIHRHPFQFVEKFRKLRRAGKVAPLVSIYLSPSQKSVNISSDGGRICRPLIIVENGGSLIIEKDIYNIISGLRKFDDLIQEGKIEYLDVNEEADSNIAVYEDQIEYESKSRGVTVSVNSSGSVERFSTNTTHLEIAPFTILGAVAGLIPYPHHNQSPRNTYQCAMGKQAMGAIAYNQFKRMDTLLYLMVYPQQPMVKTRTIEMIGYDKLPAGQAATVAVMSYSGYDIEDALVMNKASLDRGFGRCQVMRRYSTMIKSYPNRTYDRLADPPTDPQSGAVLEKFSALESDGIAGVGEKLQHGMIYVNKQMPMETSRIATNDETGRMDMDPTAVPYKATPLTFKYPAEACVDQVLLTTNEEDQTLIKVLIRQTRRPELGDKFSSRHGQKGVVGNIVNQEDMPFTDSGVCPDVIMNPHGFPSRMTVGKMIELLAGKAGVLKGELQYGTCFGGSKVEDMSSILIDNGFNYSGKDYLTSGITGESLEAYIFFGPIYYQKLKHMVMDKMHARSRGPRAVLTRQPTEGRSRDGGLRVGEMERDCLIGHGAASLLIERLLFSSDSYQAEVCKTCGLIGGWQGFCQYCKSRNGIVEVKIPYACKLLFQEMMSMNIVPRIEVGHWE